MQLNLRLSRGFLIRLAVSFLLLAALFLTAQRALAQHGCTAGNLIPNCNFDGPYVTQDRPDWAVPSGWTGYLLSGSLSFRQSEDTMYGAPSLEMISDGTNFEAGVFALVSNAQPGTAYKASAGWFAPSAPTNSFCRKLGIDPTGGTNPAASTVVWGPTHCGDGRRVNYPPPEPNIDVSAVARSSTITVFANAHHTFSTGVNFIFLDAVELIVDPSQPAAPPPPPPTATAAPVEVAPTQVPPTRIPPTRTFTPAPTATPTETATPTNTATFTPSPTPTDTPTPEPTATPTVTPSSTLPPRPPATAAPARVSGLKLLQGAGGPGERRPGLLFGGLGALGGAGILAVAAAVVRKR
jgi:hypothetical protein